jgi:Galactose oxidase, central domain/Kelch motif
MPAIGVAAMFSLGVKTARSVSGPLSVASKNKGAPLTVATPASALSVVRYLLLNPRRQEFQEKHEETTLRKSTNNIFGWTRFGGGDKISMLLEDKADGSRLDSWQNRVPIMKRFSLTFLLTVFASIGAVTAQAQSSIVLNPERAAHEATRLNSGKVLITGGVNESATLNSALLYDPVSGTLVPTGSMTSARAFHTSTLLADGRVLITGGNQGTGVPVLKSCEIYDPATGVFTQVSRAMHVPRDHHTATLLPNGQVLIVGGKSADLFDPNTQIFTEIMDAPSKRSSHATILLPDGTVLVTGGYVGHVAATDAWVFNPQTQVFTLLSAHLLVARANHEMTPLPDGRVLVTGGFSGTSPHDHVDIFDPIQQTFTAARKMLYHRSSHRALPLADGRVLVIGGTTLESGFLDVNEVYDPTSNTWSIDGTMQQNRTGHTATMLLNGTVLTAGGFTGNRTLLTAEVLDPTTRSFVSLGNMRVGRNQQSDTVLPDGKVLLAGGSVDTVYLNSAEVFDPADNSFTLVGSLSQARKSHTATLLRDNRVLITGGKTGNGDSDIAELYTPSTGQFALTGSMNQERSLHTATLLNSGKVLVVAGRNGATPLKTAELYDPASGNFSPTGELNVQRKRHRATLMPAGNVLVEGGASLDNGEPVDTGTPTAEIYVPRTGTWTQVGDMSDGRTEHDATLLPDGTVLITGGISFVDPSDLYHKSTRSFSQVAGVLQPRQRHVAILLTNPAWGSLTGKVLVTGGASTGNSIYGGIQKALDSVELYDPTTSQMSLFGTMTTPRQNHTATLLSDGRILIAGGVSSPSVSATAELVTP